MKKTLTVVLCFTAFAAGAQKMAASKVPAAVLASFSKAFPAVKDAKWEAENGDYEANFKEGSQKMSALFDASGAWKETEKSIPVASLPTVAATYMKAHYAGAKLKGAAELKMADGSTNYEAEVKGKDVFFDSKGGFLKEVKD